MLYLKSINEYNLSNEYYQNISEPEFTKKLQLHQIKDMLDITQEEYVLIRKEINYRLELKTTNFKDCLMAEISGYINNRISWVTQNILVYKYKDEWYYVRVILVSENRSIPKYNIYYKCDQFSGLEEFMIKEPQIIFDELKSGEIKMEQHR